MRPVMMPVWLATPFGILAGLACGTILASLYLTFVLGLSFVTFDFLTVWKVTAQDRILYPEAMRVAYGVMGTLAVVMGLFSFVWTFQRQRDEYGQAHWQTKREMKKNGMLQPLGTGFICGKLSKPSGNGAYVSCRDHAHVLMVAPTGAGKGVGFVVPNILAFKGSMVVLDVKGENFEKTARYRSKIGDEVFRFSPFDWINSTHRYNPLARIARLENFEQQFTEVSIMAELFLDKDNRQADTFSEAGKTIFVAACMLAIQRRTPTLGAVRAIVAEGGNKNEQFLAYADEAADETTRLLWTNAAAASDRLLTSNIQALMTAGLKTWDNPAVRRATAESDFDFSTFRKQPQCLYLAVSEDHIQTLAPLLRLIFADLISNLRDHEPDQDEPWPVMMMIDEFQQMGAMPYIERAIHTLRSYGGHVALIAQSLAALDGIYGKENRESLENGAGVKLYIAPRDTRTIEELSVAVGSTTREAVTHSFGRNRGVLGAENTSVRLEERPLLSKTEARTMDPDKVIVLVSSQFPVKCDRIKDFEDPVFIEKAKSQKGRDYPYPPKHIEDPTPGTAAKDLIPAERAESETTTKRTKRQTNKLSIGVVNGGRGVPLPENQSLDVPITDEQRAVISNALARIEEMKGREL